LIEKEECEAVMAPTGVLNFIYKTSGLI